MSAKHFNIFYFTLIRFIVLWKVAVIALLVEDIIYYKFFDILDSKKIKYLMYVQFLLEWTYEITHVQKAVLFQIILFIMIQVIMKQQKNKIDEKRVIQRINLVKIKLD